MTAAEPELIAHHYTAAGLITAAVPYWERAGARATGRSAYVEAISHYRNGLDFLRSLPEGRERRSPGAVASDGSWRCLSWTRGFAAAEVEAAYNRAHALSSQLGETSDSVPHPVGSLAFLRHPGRSGCGLEAQRRGLATRPADPGPIPPAAYPSDPRRDRPWRGEFVTAFGETSDCLAGPVEVQAKPFRASRIRSSCAVCGGPVPLALGLSWTRPLQRRRRARTGEGFDAVRRLRRRAHRGRLDSFAAP